MKMNRATAEVVGQALAAHVTDDCANLQIPQVYYFTGRVFFEPISSLVYYEMDIIERGRAQLTSMYVRLHSGLSYVETSGYGLALEHIELEG